MKICGKCREWLPSEMFSRDKQTQSGLRCYCKNCEKERYRRVYKHNVAYIEKRKIYSKHYRIKNPEKIKELYKQSKDKYNKSRKERYRAGQPAEREALKKWYREHTQSRIWSSAKKRARVLQIPFNLTKEDILIPERCPILDIYLVTNDNHAGDSSPSIDRINPALGYVKGNIVIISHKANTMKSNATIEEIEKLLNFYKRLEVSDHHNLSD